MYRQSISFSLMPLLSLYANFTHWLEGNMFSCPSKKYLHIECPGCGLQRSFIALLRGDLITSFQFYPATIPILLMFGFTILHLKYKFEQGAPLIKYSQIGIAIVIVVFYIYKIINHKIIA
jgi:Protein of unknown function (DUF2752)